MEVATEQAPPCRGATRGGPAPLQQFLVALVGAADDAALDAIIEAMPLDMWQLHGHESPERVAEVRARFGLTKRAPA